MNDVRLWALSTVERLGPERFAAGLSALVLVVFGLLVLVLATR